MVAYGRHGEETGSVAREGRGVPIRVEECPNCNHRAAAHRALDADAEAHCSGDADARGCPCPLDRAAVGIAIGVAAALVKFG